MFIMLPSFHTMILLSLYFIGGSYHRWTDDESSTVQMHFKHFIETDNAGDHELSSPGKQSLTYLARQDLGAIMANYTRSLLCLCWH